MQHPLEHLPLILVSGQARSGTTMLTQALGSHPAVYSNMKESLVIDDLGGVLRTNLSTPHRLSEFSVSSEQFVSRFRTALFHVLFPWSEGPGSKLPKAVSTFSSLRIENVEYVKCLFPKVVFANIFRNGVEVVCSRMIHPHIGKFSFEHHCTAWAHSIDIMRWGDGRDDFVAVPHHGMLKRKTTQESFEQILSKSGIADPLPCVDFVHSNVVNTLVGEHEKIGELANRIERWRSWNSEQRDQFEQICGDTMQHFGFVIPWHD